VASLSQGRTAAAQCGLFTHKSVPVIFEPPCISTFSPVFCRRWTLSPAQTEEKMEIKGLIGNICICQIFNDKRKQEIQKKSFKFCRTLQIM